MTQKGQNHRARGNKEIPKDTSTSKCVEALSEHSSHPSTEIRKGRSFGQLTTNCDAIHSMVHISVNLKDD